ncbi:MAG: hypothetical protein ABW206_03340 [Agrobacterium vaccinii]
MANAENANAVIIADLQMVFMALFVFMSLSNNGILFSSDAWLPPAGKIAGVV